MGEPVWENQWRDVFVEPVNALGPFYTKSVDNLPRNHNHQQSYLWADFCSEIPYVQCRMAPDDARPASNALMAAIWFRLILFYVDNIIKARPCFRNGSQDRYWPAPLACLSTGPLTLPAAILCLIPALAWAWGKSISFCIPCFGPMCSTCEKFDGPEMSLDRRSL